MTFTPRPYQTEAVQSVVPFSGKKLIVIPTGGGKSYVAGKIACNALHLTGRTLVLAHVKELVVQNAKAILKADPNADIGIVCSGIKKQSLPDELKPSLGKTNAAITIASIASVFRKLDYWDDVGLILIDEAHRISPSGGKQYRAVYDRFPDVPVVGLTATPFRLGSGYLHEGKDRLFDSIAYEISYSALVEAGFLAPFATKGSNLAYETGGLKKAAGDFSQASLNELVKEETKTLRIVEQMVQRAADRKHWMIFAMNVEHAKLIKGYLEDRNITAGIVYNESHKDGFDRDSEIELFQMGVYRALISVNALTTGFDSPQVDCIALLRPTCSPVVFVQSIGRGTRISPDTGKKDCLVLDYGGNVSRHGDFSKPEVIIAGTSKRQKECNSCGERNSMGARQCGACGSKFLDMHKKCRKCSIYVDKSATRCIKGFEMHDGKHVDVEGCQYVWPLNDEKLDEEGNILIGNTAIWVDIDTWTAKRRTPRRMAGETQRPDNVKVTYKGIGGVSFDEYVLPEHKNMREKFAMFWVTSHQETALTQGASRRRVQIPHTAEETAKRWNELRVPRSVKVKKDGNFYKVLSRKY